MQIGEICDMFIKSENPQAHQSQQLIADALLSLMTIYPYEEITITQICQKAQVARRTFYRNFEFKIYILEYYIDNMIQKYLADYYDPELTMQEELKYFFDFLLQHKEFWVLLDRHNLFYLLNNALTRYLTQFLYVPKIMVTIREPKLDIYVLGFITSTLCSNISLWVKNNFEVSSDMMVDLTTIFLSGLQNALNFKTE
jgi:AcrR family transcriptional regulator